MRRFKKGIVSFAVLALVAVACGGDNGGNGAAQPTLKDLAGQSLTVAAVWSGSEQESFEAVLDLFEQDTGATTTFVSTGNDIAAFLGGRIEGGNPPDVAVLPNPGLLNDLATRNQLKAVPSDVGDVVDNNYAPVWRDLGTVNNTLYGVWFKGANKSTVWYNIKAFDDAGVEPPETWENFKQVLTTLSDAGIEPVSVGGADGWTLTDWFENVYIRTAGPEKYDQLANHEIPWTDESVKDALRTLAEVLGQEEFLAGGRQGALSTNFDNSVVNTFTSPSKAAIVYEGDFVAGVITSDTNAELGTDADFFDFPSIDGSQPAVVGGGDVAVMLKDNEAARELMKFLATPEAAEVWAKRGGFTSPNQELNLDVYPDDISRKSARALANAETFRFDLSDLQPAAFGGTPGQGLWKQLQDFVQNPTDIDGLTQQMEQAAARAFG